MEQAFREVGRRLDTVRRLGHETKEHGKESLAQPPLRITSRDSWQPSLQALSASSSWLVALLTAYRASKTSPTSQLGHYSSETGDKIWPEFPIGTHPARPVVGEQCSRCQLAATTTCKLRIAIRLTENDPHVADVMCTSAESGCDSKDQR